MTAPFLSAVIIGRNESRFIENCLRSLSGVVDEIVYLDTGSTDGTAYIACEVGRELDASFVYGHFAWCDDFSAARNYAASLASGRWILSIDCDETLHGALCEPGKLKESLREFEDDAPGMWPRFFVRIPLFDTNIEDTRRAGVSQHVRIYPRDTDIHYVSPIHNRLVMKGRLEGDPVALMVYSVEQLHFLHRGYDPRVIASQSKRERSMRLLRKALAENRDGLNLYYLGREYFQTGQPHKALEVLEEAKEYFLKSDEHDAVERLHGVYCYLIQALEAVGASVERVHQEALQALESYKGSADLWYIAGQSLYNLGAVEAALGAFKTVEQLLPQAKLRATSFLPWKSWEVYQNIAAVCAQMGLDDEGRSYLRKAINAEAPDAVYIQEFLDSRKPDALIHGGVASIYERRAHLEVMFNSIISQVDVLHVYLDGEWPDTPAFLDDPKVVVHYAAQRRKDVGKFFGLLDREWAYFFSLDDDIMYPPNYVSRMVELFKEESDTVVLGVHGSDLNPAICSYIRDRTIWPFATAVQDTLPVDVLGTGTMVLRRTPSSFSPEELFMALHNPGMTDVDVACFLERRGIQRHMVSRRESWLLPLQSEGLYEEALIDDTKQTQLICDVFDVELVM